MFACERRLFRPCRASMRFRLPQENRSGLRRLRSFRSRRLCLGTTGMSVRRHSMSLNLDRLTAQEQDLLRLLAQGHTAKTIANLTGLSVNSVNERLRSARRKTGAVSSRELARRLADQAP